MKNASGTSTIDWDGDVIDNAYAGSGNDTIMGNGAGNKTNGGGDDDVIDVGDGAGGDNVGCGDGNDTVYRDPPDPANNDPGDTVSPNCEVQEDPEPPRPALS